MLSESSPKIRSQVPPTSCATIFTEPGADAVKTSDSGVGPNRPSASSANSPTLAQARITRSSAPAFTSSPLASCAAVIGPRTWSVSGIFSLEISDIALATQPPMAICITTACGGGTACGAELVNITIVSPSWLELLNQVSLYDENAGMAFRVVEN